MRYVMLHQFRMGDCEDPYLYAAQPLHDFMQTEAGKWIKHNSHDPTFHVTEDVATMGFKVTIYAYLDDAAYTYYALRWA